DLVQLARPSAERDRDDELDRLGDVPASEAAGFADGMPTVRCAVADAADARDPCRRYPDEDCPKRLDDLPAGPHAAIKYRSPLEQVPSSAAATRQRAPVRRRPAPSPDRGSASPSRCPPRDLRRRRLAGPAERRGEPACVS